MLLATIHGGTPIHDNKVDNSFKKPFPFWGKAFLVTFFARQNHNI